MFFAVDQIILNRYIEIISFQGLPADVVADRTCRTLLAATLTGMSEAIVATPFERGQSLLQTPAFHGKIKNTLDLR